MHRAPHTGHTTHPALHLRDAADAHVIFEAVRQGLLPLIKRRLTSEERDQLSSGNVFVWEEAEHKGGLERWTDGRRWSQSRMKGEYLFYEEKVETTEEEKQAKAARRANRNAGPQSPVYTPTRRQDRPAKPDGLTKQTYSTHVYLPGSSSPRKWHIVAYFSGNDYTRLPVVENYDYLRTLRIPDGVFFSSKGIIRKNERYASNSEDEDDEFNSGSTDGGSYGPSSPVQAYSTSAEHSQRQRYGGQHTDAHYASGGHNVPHSSSFVPRPAPSRALSHDSAALPRLSTIAPLPSPHHLPYSPSSQNQSGSGHLRIHPPSSSSTQNYLPLSPEDRRALNTFKVVL